MNWIERKQIGEILLNNMEDLTKEQYFETVRLLEEMDAELIGSYQLPEDAEPSFPNK